MTNLSRRTLLRGVTVLTAAAVLPRSGIMTVVDGMGTNCAWEVGR